MSLKMLRTILAVVSVITVGVIIWIDIATDLWQKYVVIAGLAAGLVTFVLTAMVVDRVIARSTHERWAPVTRLALGDLQRQFTIGGDKHNRTTVRQLPTVDTPESLNALIKTASAEREALASALARWASFLSASADVSDIMDAVADVAQRLDTIDATALEIQRTPVDPGGSDEAPRTSLMNRLLTEIDAYHHAGEHLLTHIEDVLRRYDRLADQEPIV